MQGSTVMLQCWWREGEGERGREGCVSSAVQCSGPVSRACYNVTLHFLTDNFTFLSSLEGHTQLLPSDHG